jgi:hypothetical protein
VADMNDIKNKVRIWLIAGLTNQTRAAAVTVKRNAINRIGGKCKIAAFAKTKPNPHTRATPSPSAISISLDFI